MLEGNTSSILHFLGNCLSEQAMAAPPATRQEVEPYVAPQASSVAGLGNLLEIQVLGPATPHPSHSALRTPWLHQNESCTGPQQPPRKKHHWPPTATGAGGEHMTRSTPQRMRCRRAWHSALTFREGLQPAKTRESLTMYLKRRGHPPGKALPTRSLKMGHPSEDRQSGEPGHSLPDHFVEALPVLRRGVLATGHLKQPVSNSLVVKLFSREMPRRPSQPPGAPRMRPNREQARGPMPRLPNVPGCAPTPSSTRQMPAPVNMRGRMASLCTTVNPPGAMSK